MDKREVLVNKSVTILKATKKSNKEIIKEARVMRIRSTLLSQ
jgi:hypothetical protein